MIKVNNEAVAHGDRLFHLIWQWGRVSVVGDTYCEVEFPDHPNAPKVIVNDGGTEGFYRGQMVFWGNPIIINPNKDDKNFDAFKAGISSMYQYWAANERAD